MMPPGRGRPLLRIFGIPTLLAIAQIAGLTAALVGDGPWKILSWLLLGAPIAVCLYHLSSIQTNG